MIIVSLLDTVLSVILLCLGYVNYEQSIPLLKILNKVDFLQYLLWANLLFFYVAQISFGTKVLFRKVRPYLIRWCIIIDTIAYLVILCLPLSFHNEDGIMYAYGPPVDLLYVLCCVYLILIILSVLVNVKNIFNKKYIPIFALLILGIIMLLVRYINPGLLIIPVAIAYINLIMFFTIENPDTKLLEMERQNRNRLKKLEAAKEDFITIASHQLRTPLTSIKGYLSMMLDNDFGHLTGEQKKVIGEAFSSSERMAFLIDDFLDVSRLQLGKFELQKIPTRLDEVLMSEIQQLKTTANARNIVIEYEAPNELPVIDLDANKLRQVMMNMIDNAIYS
ncbi:MAG: HAMP domain-containing histidine kinase, partial [Candidatus Nomurabacteria bacterium]|nr:HAMP domain-containing histidine kinase [Candidatus Nomurabacteria bacterium]